GSAKPGDYDPLVAQVTSALAGQPRPYAVYMFYYDYINEWFSQRTQSPLAITQLANALHARMGGPGLGNTVASFLGDVIWPILSLAARDALLTALLRQIRQMLLDGAEAGVPMPQRHLSIICHSLGCFHVFEAIHAAANDPVQQLSPAQGVQFDNVIFMASPVQLIRTIAKDISFAVPRASDLACMNPEGLFLPSQDDGFGTMLPAVKQTVSITGNLDPVGGYLFRDRLDWAYMNLPNQISKIDSQELVDMKAADLQAILQQALQTDAPPKIAPQNPHDWSAYVSRHSSDLKTWLV
ncbi:MAG: hypothetical protein ABI442_09615, partial [Gemmatimonadaceae bacterium]